jgi:DNA-binding transcriptional ArsR family regulator
MSSNPNIMEVASLIGEPSRIAMLVSLLGGKALPASELASSARISPQTASSHLAKLVEGGLLRHESYGRHKYFRLASSEVANALEALQAIAPQKPVRSLRESDQLKALQYARTCYRSIRIVISSKMLKCMQVFGNFAKSPFNSIIGPAFNISSVTHSDNFT